MNVQMPDPAVAATQLTVAVAGAFLFIFVGAFLVLVVQRAARGPVSALSVGLRRFDAFLALRLAGLLGLDERAAVRRWGRLAAWFLGIAAAGAFLPALLATPLLLLGLALVLAVVRRWTWDEEDRALGLASHHKRAPGGEDFNNELVAALSCVFLFGALLVWRLAELGFFDLDPAAARGGNILYVASEALEALPIVGNIEVFGYDNPSGVEVVQPTGGSAAFVFRLVLDVLVIGGLLKAAEIAGRIARKEDIRREEQALARARTDAEVDAALEAIVDLARRGNARAARALEAVALPPLDGAPLPVRLRRAAADHLLTLGEEGTVMGPGALNTAILAYQVLMTPELKEADPVEWHRCLASRSGALYTLSLRAGGGGGAARLEEAAGGLQEAARGLHMLGQVIDADRAELVYWAAMVQLENIARETPGVTLMTLATQVQDFIERMKAQPIFDPRIVAEAQRLLGGIRTSAAAHGHGEVDLVGLAEQAGRRLSPAELTDHAAAVNLAVGRSPSPEGFALLEQVVIQMKGLVDDPQATAAERATAAFRICQSCRLQAELVHDGSRAQVIEEGLHWAEATIRMAGRDVPRIAAAARQVEAECLRMKAALTTSPPEKDALIVRALETYRRIIHDPALAGDALVDEVRANLVVALIGAAAVPDAALAVSRLREAESLGGDLLGAPTTARDRAMEASVLLNRSVGRRSLAQLEPPDLRRALLEGALDDARRSAELNAAAGIDHGETLALKSLGHAHADLAALEGSGPAAHAHARSALSFLDRALSTLSPDRQPGLWAEAAFTSLTMMEVLGHVDRDRELLERAVSRFDALIEAWRDGPMAAQTPFLEQRRAKVLASLKSWSA